MVVQLRDGSLCVLIGGHFNEREAAGAARFAIPHDIDRFNGACLGKQRLQVVFVGLVRDVADVKLATHFTDSCIPSRDALARAHALRAN